MAWSGAKTDDVLGSIYGNFYSQEDLATMPGFSIANT